MHVAFAIGEMLGASDAGVRLAASKPIVLA